jgi:hypothetical protein
MISVLISMKYEEWKRTSGTDIEKKNRQFPFNVTLSRLRLTTVATENNEVLNTTRFCLLPGKKNTSGFNGLGVRCWPLVPKFAGSNPAEAVGFLRTAKVGNSKTLG